jgi:hypothetical protein
MEKLQHHKNVKRINQGWKIRNIAMFLCQSNSTSKQELSGSEFNPRFAKIHEKNAQNNTHAQERRSVSHYTYV